MSLNVNVGYADPLVNGNVNGDETEVVKTLGGHCHWLLWSPVIGWVGPRLKFNLGAISGALNVN